jgi:hypothetical protein
MLLAKGMQERLAGVENRDLRDRLAAMQDFFLVGAVAPDLPYASAADRFIFDSESELADSFHYDNTNSLPLLALSKVRTLHESGAAPQLVDAVFAFVLGYISHLVADGIIHPFVRDKVGDYKENSREHRALEMALDVLFLDALTVSSGEGSDFNFTNLHDDLLNFDDYGPITDLVVDAFRQCIREVYGHDLSSEKIRGWVTGLHRLFEVAEGEQFPWLYRRLEITGAFAYRNIEDIRLKRETFLCLGKPKDRDENFLLKDKVHFLEDCVPQFYQVFVPLAERVHQYVFQPEAELTIADINIPAIDLDTGRLLVAKGLENRPVLWSLA